MKKMNNKRLFTKLKQHFGRKIKLYFVNQFEVITIVTNDDKVYRLTKDFRGSLITVSLSDEKSLIASLIEEFIDEKLCNKRIIDVKSSVFHTFALSSDGKVYSWGYNTYGLLGNGGDHNEYEPQINEYLRDKKVTRICCGNAHSLVLTSDGQVYAWGENMSAQIGNGSVQNQSIPYLLEGFWFNGEKVIHIACGDSYSLALTESGLVFGWGHNGWGQLGYYTSSTLSYRPQTVQINDVYFKKISCGFSHSLLLSTDGDIYVFGCNDLGQLGCDTVCSKQYTPIKLDLPVKFIDIASHYFTDFSAALSKNGLLEKYYVWGLCGEEEKIYYPKETNFKSFNDVFENYSEMTYASNKNFSSGFSYNLTDDGIYKDYKQIEKLGEGSYGKVFKVIDNYEEVKAVKVIQFQINHVNQLLKEIQILSLLENVRDKRIVEYSRLWLENNSSSKNVIKCFNLFIEMEICDKTLTQLIQEIEVNKVLKDSDILTQLGFCINTYIFKEILKGVKYLHKRQIIHRDLKPDNILVKKTDNNEILIKIADFGLVTIHEFAEKTHKKGIGDLDFIAPEVENGEEYDTRADIYNLGLILQKLFFIDMKRTYYMIPDGDGDQMDYSYSFFMPNYQCLKIICGKMIKKNPDERYQDCKEILDYMKEYLIFDSRELSSFEEFIMISDLCTIKKQFYLSWIWFTIMVEIMIIIKRKYGFHLNMYLHLQKIGQNLFNYDKKMMYEKALKTISRLPTPYSILLIKLTSCKRVPIYEVTSHSD